jgi:hypothetical protein
VACPFQVTGHRRAHDAQSQERNLAQAATSTRSTGGQDYPEIDRPAIFGPR